MIGIAVASVDIDKLKIYKDKKGFKLAQNLCENTEKVSSFCCDVVGDICGILSGAGGVSLVLNINITDSSVYFVVTCIVSSLIAGLTIFGKAIMKGYSVEHCDKVLMKTAQVLETSPFSVFKRKKKTKLNNDATKIQKDIKKNTK